MIGKKLEQTNILCAKIFKHTTEITNSEQALTLMMNDISDWRP